MTGLAADRRTFLKGLGVLGAAALVPGCATSTKSPGSGSAATGELALQSNLSSEQAKAAMEKVVAAYNKTGGSQVKLNTVASEIDPAADVPPRRTRRTSTPGTPVRSRTRTRRRTCCSTSPASGTG